MKRRWCLFLTVMLLVGMAGTAVWGLEDEASPDVYMEYSYYTRPKVDEPGYSVSVINAEYEFYLAFFQEDGRLVEGSPLYHLADYWSNARAFDTGDGYALFYHSVLDTLDYVLCILGDCGGTAILHLLEGKPLLLHHGILRGPVYHAGV